MKNSHLTASKLYIALIASLVIITAGTGVGFYFMHDKLSMFATDVSKSVAAADVSSHSLQRLQKTEQSLKDNQAVIKNVKSIVAVAESYKYQNQILNDINKYAKKSGVTVTQYSFAETSSGEKKSAASSAKTPTAPAGTTPAPSGLKTASVSVTIKNPTSYRSLLKFIKHIENNLTNMQIANISMTGGDKGSEVTSDVFNIEVHIK
ncbi:MAG: hypothetical protein L0H36_01490 [bacterium]|nr:hypothetical protein [bacterium]MDN5835290.1 hypothetical protein [bacterium]